VSEWAFSDCFGSDCFGWFRKYKVSGLGCLNNIIDFITITKENPNKFTYNIIERDNQNTSLVAFQTFVDSLQGYHVITSRQSSIMAEENDNEMFNSIPEKILHCCFSVLKNKKFKFILINQNQNFRGYLFFLKFIIYFSLIFLIAK